MVDEDQPAFIGLGRRAMLQRPLPTWYCFATPLPLPSVQQYPITHHVEATTDKLPISTAISYCDYCNSKFPQFRFRSEPLSLAQRQIWQKLYGDAKDISIEVCHYF